MKTLIRILFLSLLAVNCFGQDINGYLLTWSDALNFWAPSNTIVISFLTVTGNTALQGTTVATKISGNGTNLLLGINTPSAGQVLTAQDATGTNNYWVTPSGGSQTPWASTIQGAGNYLLFGNISNAQDIATSNLLVLGNATVTGTQTVGTLNSTNTYVLGPLAITNLSIEPVGASTVGAILTLTNIGTGQAAWSNAFPAVDLYGTLPAAQMPALTGDITTSAGSVATTLKSTGTAGTYVITTFDSNGRETSGTTWPVTNQMAGSGIINAALLDQTCITNVAFGFGLPINLVAGQNNQPIVEVYNTSGTLKAITPNSYWYTIGTWNVTNWSRVFVSCIPGIVTNALCVPVW